MAEVPHILEYAADRRKTEAPWRIGFLVLALPSAIVPFARVPAHFTPPWDVLHDAGAWEDLRNGFGEPLPQAVPFFLAFFIVLWKLRMCFRREPSAIERGLALAAAAAGTICEVAGLYWMDSTLLHCKWDFPLFINLAKVNGAALILAGTGLLLCLMAKHSERSALVNVCLLGPYLANAVLWLLGGGWNIGGGIILATALFFAFELSWTAVRTWRVRSAGLLH